MSRTIRDIYMYVCKYGMKLKLKRGKNGEYEVTVHNHHTHPPHLAYEYTFILESKDGLV